MSDTIPRPTLPDGLDLPARKTASGMAYRVAGQGPALVLLHGGVGSWLHWIRLIPALEARFRVYAVDLPSYGDSEAVDWETPTDRYLELVETGLIQMVGEAPNVHIAGFSFGGFIAADMAVRFGVRTASLSMTGGAGYGPPEGRGFTLDSRRRMAERLGREPAAHEIRAMHQENLGKLMIWDQDKIDDWAVDMQIWSVSRARFDSRRLSWADGTPSRLSQLNCPAAVIYGVHDAAAVPPVAERFRRCRAAKADVATHLIPDCGHWAMYEAPEASAALLLTAHGATA